MVGVRVDFLGEFWNRHGPAPQGSLIRGGQPLATSCSRNKYQAFLHCREQKTQVLLLEEWEGRRVKHVFIFLPDCRISSSPAGIITVASYLVSLTSAILLPDWLFSQTTGRKSVSETLAATSSSTPYSWMWPCLCKCWILHFTWHEPTYLWSPSIKLCLRCDSPLPSP